VIPVCGPAWSQEGVALILIAGRRREVCWKRAAYATGGSLRHLAQGRGPHWARMARPAVASDRFALSRAGPRRPVMGRTYTCDGPGVYLVGRRR
jgi:hypothetical protein